mmetsp:Transcript_8779/g.14600  ORF Transcript_8779/g.14600 Transcript_8779/m.14600 type:complete len:258 (+) Transcript_8779:98-871(+)
MSLDPKTLEQRLLYRDSTVSLPSLTKVANKLQCFGKNLDDSKVLESFLRELLLYKLEIDKTERVFESLDRQSDEYDALEASIKEKIAWTNNDILRLEEELSQQKVVREHRVECEGIAATVNKHPSRSTLKRKIDSVTANLETTETSIDQVHLETTQKYELFKKLLAAIEALQRKDEDPPVAPTAGGDVLGDEEGADEGDEVDNDRSAVRGGNSNSEKESPTEADAQEQEGEVEEDDGIVDVGEGDQEGHEDGEDNDD